MWPFGRKSVRQRRLEVRRNIASGPSLLSRWFQRPGAISSFTVLIVLAGLVAGLAIWPPQPMLYREGQYISQPIRARVDFRILDEDRLADTAEKAESSEPATFQLNDAEIEETISRLEKIPGTLQAAESLDKVEPALRARLGLPAPEKQLAEIKTLQSQLDPLTAKIEAAEKSETPPSDIDLDVLKKQSKELEAQMAGLRNAAEKIQTQNLEVYKAWVALGEADARPRLEGLLRQLREELQRLYLVRTEPAEQQQQRAARWVLLVDGEDQIRQKVVDLIAQDESEKLANRVVRIADIFPPKIRDGVFKFLTLRLLAQPLYLYDPEKSSSAIQAAAQAVRNKPPDTVYKRFEKGQILADASRTNDDQPGSVGLDRADLELLQREHLEYLSVSQSLHPWQILLSKISRAMLAGLLILGLGGYIARYEPLITNKPHRALLLGCTILLMLLVAKCVIFFPQLNPHFVLLPVCMMAAILSIAYNQRFALAVSSLLAGLVVFVTYQNYEMLLVLLVGLVVIIYQLQDIRTRSKLPLSSTLTALCVAALVWGVSMKNSIPWPFAMRDSLWAAGAVLLSGFIVQGLLPAIEKIFQCTTSSTLLEWCDAAKPLLRRLNMESPGTYNHSLQLGAMCEAAADRIGARGLLARVGAYYHDIGKINKPGYFTENQNSGENKHDRLSPAMSVLVILGHVKDGLEMAREYNLPSPLLEFIATHHGTQLVRYFYHQAAMQHEDEGSAEPEESQFRYPGPKPRSREAAILMLADAAESSVRAMTEPTPTRIRTQVHQRVTERLEDGQLDDCLLTLREVHEIEESLIKSLCGMYHGRIAYPKDASKSKASDERVSTESQKAEDEKSEKSDTDEKAAEESTASADSDNDKPDPSGNDEEGEQVELAEDAADDDEHEQAEDAEDTEETQAAREAK